MAKALPFERLSDELPTAAGPIGLLSSDEFTSATAGFDRAMIEATGPRVALVLCADHEHEAANAERARAHLAALGAEATAVEVRHGPRAEARALPDYDLLYLPGGSPKELLGCLRRSPLWEGALMRWRAGAGLAGSSAGAMALSVHCLEPTEGASVPTVWSEGLGPLRSVGLAVHAASRPQEWLSGIARTAPAPVLAIDDRTGVILTPGARPTVLGEGMAWLV